MSWKKPPIVHYMYKGTSSKRLDLFYVNECLILASKRKNRLRCMFSRRRKEPVRYNIPVYTVTKMNGKLLKITDVNKDEHTIRVCSKSTVKVDEVYLQLVKELVSASTSVDEVNSETENVMNHEVEEEIEVTQVKEKTENETEVEMKDEVVMVINEREEQCNEEEVVESSSTEKEVMKVFEYESVAGEKDEEKEIAEVEEDQEESETADDKKEGQEHENEEEGFELKVDKKIEGLREQDAVDEEKVEVIEAKDEQELEIMLELKEERSVIVNKLEVEQVNIDYGVHSEFEETETEESLNNENEMEKMEEKLMVIKDWAEQCNVGVVESDSEKEIYEPKAYKQEEEKQTTEVEEELEEYEPEDETKGGQEYVEEEYGVTEYNEMNEERDEAEDEEGEAEVDEDTVEKQDAESELEEEGFEVKDEQEMEAIFEMKEAESEIEKEVENKLEEEKLKIDNGMQNELEEKAEESVNKESKVQRSAEILMDINEKEEQCKEEMYALNKGSEVKLAEVHIMKYEEQEIHDVVTKEENDDTLDTGGKAVEEVLDKKIEDCKVDMKDEDEEKAEEEMNSSDNSETMEYYTFEGGFGINMPIDYWVIGTNTKNRPRKEQHIVTNPTNLKGDGPDCKFLCITNLHFTAKLQ